MSATEPRPTTTGGGAPVARDEHSLTLGADGPAVLQDHYLIEQTAAFDRERIPERQPQANGGGAFGDFGTLEYWKNIDRATGDWNEQTVQEARTAAGAAQR
jgi:catalase